MFGIQPAAGQQYTDGMVTDDNRSLSLTPHRFSIHLPTPLSIGLTAVVLLVTSVGLSVGLPIYRQHAAIGAIR